MTDFSISCTMILGLPATRLPGCPCCVGLSKPRHMLPPLLLPPPLPSAHPPPSPSLFPPVLASSSPPHNQSSLDELRRRAREHSEVLATTREHSEALAKTREHSDVLARSRRHDIDDVTTTCDAGDAPDDQLQRNSAASV